MKKMTVAWAKQIDVSARHKKTASNYQLKAVLNFVGMTGHFSNLFLEDLARINAYVGQFGK
jgi:hypothetical protein